MTTEEEALSQTRANLAEAGVEMDADGRVVPISGLLNRIAAEGGGVLDADTAATWGLRVEAGEQALIELSKALMNTLHLAKTPGLEGIAWPLYSKGAVTTLARAIPQFVYGLSPEALIEKADSLLEFRKAEQAGLGEPEPEGSE